MAGRPPCGLHVVFLGADGVGKSTVIDAVRGQISPAFTGTDYHTFAPSLLPAKMQAKPSPHAYPPRSLPASLLKAGWWLVCYTAGYALVTHPARARSRLVLNHRYFLDAIADTKRYRYGGPVWLLRLVWRVIPKPNVIILLDAPPEVIQSRKREVPPEETARQRTAYRRLVEPLPYGHVISTARPLDEVAAEVDRIILGVVAEKAARRLRLYVQAFQPAELL